VERTIKRSRARMYNISRPCCLAPKQEKSSRHFFRTNQNGRHRKSSWAALLTPELCDLSVPGIVVFLPCHIITSTQRARPGSTRKWTEGGAPVRGSEFTSNGATLQAGGQIGAQPFCSGLWKPRELRVRKCIVREVARAEEFAERQLRVTAPITPGSRSKSTARGTYLPPKASW
jgi:hypothetical protein